MADQVQRRGGTEAENDAFTGVDREITVDTTNKTLRVHDGTKQGGFPVLGEAKLKNVDTLSDLKALEADAFEQVYMRGRVSVGDGAHGVFVWRTGDQSANVTADSGEGIWVPPDSDATGASGAWERLAGLPADVRWWGAVPDDDTVDDTSAFNNALGYAEYVIAGQGQYRIDGTVTVDFGAHLELSVEAILRKLSAKTADTGPVLQVLHNYSSSNGGRFVSENDSPNGVVRLGHEKSDGTEPTTTYWMFHNAFVKGNRAGGANTIGILVHSDQPTGGAANYFGSIAHVRVQDADYGLRFARAANAHNFTDLQFSNIGATALDFKGATENNGSNVFVHTSDSGMVCVDFRSDTTNSTRNILTGFSVEPGAGTTGYNFEAGCNNNVLLSQINAPATGSNLGTANLIINAGKSLNAPDGNLYVNGILSGNGRRVFKAGGLTLGENATRDVLQLASVPNNTNLIVRLGVTVASTSNVGQEDTLIGIFRVWRDGGGLAASLVNAWQDNEFPADNRLFEPVVSGGDVFFSIRTRNNSTAASFDVSVTAEIEGGNINSQTISLVDQAQTGTPTEIPLGNVFNAPIDLTGVGASTEAIVATATSDTPSSSPETDAEQGWIKIKVGGVDRYIPFYN